jgi:dihydrofolate synthase/folylpolyglutamate synthase
MQISSQARVANEAQELRFATLAEWLAWQETLHSSEIELGLERCRRVAEAMGLLQPAYRVVSVAGTNGKGSSVAMLDLILRKAGYRVGCYSSPHLVRYNERVRVNGVEASDAALCLAFERINRARGDTSLTYFEFGTLAALDLFREATIDVAVLEVGLGGRLDAVNIVDADVALVTAIDLDHQNWLGPDRASIAREKAGIFRPGKPAACSDPDPPATLVEHAARLGTPLAVLGRDYHAEAQDGGWYWRAGDVQYHDLPHPDRFNECQIQNAAGVLMAIHRLAPLLPVPESAVRAALSEFRLGGRLQIIPGPVQYVLDVAHNPHAARMLARNLRKIPAAGNTHVIIGMLCDKDHPGFFRELMDIVDAWHVVSLPGSRGTASSVLVGELAQLGITQDVTAHDSVAAALAHVRPLTRTGDRVLITGSFLTVGAALEQLEGRS